MQLNKRPKSIKTYEGAPAKRITVQEQLRRSVMSCLLWEREFYEDGQAIADRIADAAKRCEPDFVADLALEARNVHNLRHVPLLLCLDLIKSGGAIAGDTIEQVIQRPDEITELLAMYWRNGRKPVTKQMRRGIGEAFSKFDEYQLAKYNRDGAVKLRDALFLSHAKPETPERESLYKRLANNELATPDTWEVGLSGGGDKREVFTRLLKEGKLGYLALLRNLRNMSDAGVDVGLVRDAIIARRGGAHRVLPFRYVAAARAAPRFAPFLDQALLESLADVRAMEGETIVLVDVSYSMDMALSARSDLTRRDAACTLASVIPGNVRVFSFSTECVEVPAYRGLAGIDAIAKSQTWSGTRLGQAVSMMNRLPHDRLIVVTDEQSQDRVPDPVAEKAYMINVASYANGVGYGPWTNISGFSENVIRFIQEMEGEPFDG